MFHAVGRGYDVAAVPLAALLARPTAAASARTSSTRRARSGFGVTLRGMDVGSSFALTPPVLLGINRPGSAKLGAQPVARSKRP